MDGTIHRNRLTCCCIWLKLPRCAMFVFGFPLRFIEIPDTPPRAAGFCCKQQEQDCVVTSPANRREKS